MAEYTGNDHDFETTAVLPFFTNYTYNSCYYGNNEPATDFSNSKAKGLTTRIKDIQDTLKDEMAQAQNICHVTADQK